MKIHNTYALMQGIEKYVVGGAVPGLTSVVWHDNQDLAFTDGSTIHLPRPNSLWTDKELLLWRYKAEHELGHEDARNSSPHWKTVMEEERKKPEYKDDGFLWHINNIVEDHVQEHNRVGEMVGRDEVLLEGRKEFLNTMVFKDFATPSKDKVEAVGRALFIWDSEHRKVWNPLVSVPAVDKQVEEYVKLLTEKSGVNPTKLTNSKQVFDASVKIRKLFEQDKELSEQLKKAFPAPGEEGDGKDGKDGKKKGKAESKEIRAKAKSFIPNPHGWQKNASKREYSYKDSQGVYQPRTPRPMDGRGRGRGAGLSGHVMERVKRTNLPAKVRAYLMAMKREKWSTGYRAGRLDTGRLTDVLRNKEDIFRRKEDVVLVNSAVSLLVDCSGSMSGEKYYQACAAAVMLAEALQGIGVRLEVAGFTELGGPTGLIHDLWTPFGQRFNRERVLEGMGRMAENMANNADGENILYAYHRLKQQKEARKILIVLNDGQPAASGPDGATMDIGQFTKNVTETIDKDKGVLLVGLGVEGYNPKRFYKNAYCVNYGEALEPVLLNIVKDAVLRSV